MPHRLRAEIHQFLHDYKKRVFEIEHNPENIEERRQRAQKFAEELLDQKFHYHFHKKVDEERAEIIQLIHNYSREALLPPVLERLADRELLIEQRHAAALELVERVLTSFAVQVDAQADGGTA